jgi:hypothetical protein
MRLSRPIVPHRPHVVRTIAPASIVPIVPAYQWIRDEGDEARGGETTSASSPAMGRTDLDG